mgnify:CR=1 FL=1
MLDEGSDAQTRAGRPFIVQDHYEYVANAKTRAVGDTIDVRFHVINFADDGGFALVSADSRTTPVYAYSETGHLDLEDAIANTGFGTFMDNAALYYVSEVGKTREIINDTTVNGTVPAPENIPDVLPLVYYNGTPYYVLYNYKETISLVSAMVTAEWGQGDPYNYYCPIVSGTTHAAAGDGPVAVGQIMSYFRKPSSVQEYGTTDPLYNHLFLWGMMMGSNSYDPGTSSAGCRNVAYLIHQIGLYAGANYGTTTTTTIGGIASAFGSFNYNKSSVCTFDSTLVRSSLDNEKLVFARGTNGISGDSHSWVIDGYRFVQEEHLYFAYAYPHGLQFKDTTGNTWTYYHCNWGQDGQYNAFVLNTFIVDGNNQYGYNNQIIYNISPKTGGGVVPVE